MAEFYFGAIGILSPAVRSAPSRRARRGHGAGPAGARSASRGIPAVAAQHQDARRAGPGVRQRPIRRPGPVRRGASHPKRCERGLDDGATSVACWHRANPALEPKVAIFATRPYLLAHATTVLSESITTKRTFLQAALVPSGRSRPALCASRHRIQAFKRGRRSFFVALEI